MSPQTHCIYHGNCPDGFTAAWLIGRAFGEDTKFTAGAYGTPAPDVTGERVIIADFSYPADELRRLADQADSLTLLDHHASAQRDLEGFQHAHAQIVFDMERSGAGIVWDWLHPTEPRPALVNYVEDRDLWRFALPHSEDIAPLFMGTHLSFDNWDTLHYVLDNDFDLARSTGSAMRQVRDKIIGEIVATARTMVIAGYEVPVAPSPYALGSDVAGELFLAEESAFAAYYVDKAEGRQFGLRSGENGIDVSEIAKTYGGGGHKHAAGFWVPWGHVLTLEGSA